MNSNNITWALRSLVMAALLLPAAGCQRAGSGPAGTHRSGVLPMRDVSGHTFELEYNAPRTRLCQWRYRGVVDGCHVLDFYGLGDGDEPAYRSSIRTLRSNLPKDFPTTPQKPVKTAFSKEDDQYFDMMQTEQRRERQMRGETGTSW